MGNRTFKVASGTTSESGRYVKSLRGARTGILYLIYLIAHEPLWHTHEHAVG